jgi:transcriptional regulator GlxA family with amidase domain
MEEQFLLDVKAQVQKHLADEQFNVEALAESLSMSRIQLHRKFKALTDGTPSRFIRKYRLETAHTLLQNKVATVAEVAFDCGFSSASYFSKCFTEEFGVAPSVVLKGGG